MLWKFLHKFSSMVTEKSSIKGQIMLTIHIFWRPEIFKPRLSWWPISFLVQLHKFQPHSQICIHIPMRLVWIFRSGRKEKSAEKEGKKIQRMCTAFAFDLYSLLALIVYCSCIDASNIICRLWKKSKNYIPNKIVSGKIIISTKLKSTMYIM